MLETEKDVLDWYERQPRALTKSFLDNIPWHEVARHPLDPAFVPVLLYMRDVESFTDIYYKELRRTPAGRDPVIKRFMERWGAEEQTHAAVLDRFLNEAAHPTDPRWQEREKAKISFRYRAENYFASAAANLFGEHFSGAHMAWGAINEMTTLQGYRRLWGLAKHPVLEHILRAVAAEESAHSYFYWSIARLKLARSHFSRRLARFVVGKFWTPVGQGTKPRHEVNYLISTLFRGAEGVQFFEHNVSRRLNRLPGFNDFPHVLDRVAVVAG